jgi:hypothetical protein
MSKAKPAMPTAVQQAPKQAAGAAGAAPEWAVGSLCMAKYAADGKFYPAEVVEVTPKGVKVSFTEYENEFQVCAAKDLKVFVVKGAPAKSSPAAAKAAPLSPKQGPKAAPVSPKQGASAKPASPSLGAMKPLSPRGSPKFSPVDPVKQARSRVVALLCVQSCNTRSGGACSPPTSSSQGCCPPEIFPVRFRPRH